VDDFVAGFEQLEVRDVECSDGLDRRGERVSASPSIRGSHLPAQLSKLAQHPRPVEALAFTVFAETHR
jgi:hypothetical protein